MHQVLQGSLPKDSSGVSAGVSAGASAGASAPGARILVVDDDEANRESLSRRLVRRGYVVGVAPDGETALQMLQHDPYELVLLDVMMPGINGLEVLSRIRQTRPPTDLPVIMVTARDASEDVVTALSMGASDYLTKPLDFAIVVARVQTQIALRAAVQQVLMLERHLVRRNADLERANADLHRAAERTKHELQLATKVQASFLPKPSPHIAGLQFAWRFQPSVELAGDALNICQLTDDSVGVYVLDVSGHGVAASLTAVSAARMLGPRDDRDSILLRDGASRFAGRGRPAAGAKLLVERPDRAVHDHVLRRSRTLRQDAPLHLCRPSARDPDIARWNRNRALKERRLPIGIEEKFDSQQAQLAPGDRVYLYSDGVIETSNADDEHFGITQLSESFSRSRSLPLDEGLSLLMQQLNDWRGGRPAADDVSVLAFELGEDAAHT